MTNVQKDDCPQSRGGCSADHGVGAANRDRRASTARSSRSSHSVR